MRKFLILTGLLSLVLVLSLSGIALAQDDVTITLMGHGSSPAEEQALRAQVDAFMEANPGITVDVQLVPEYETVIRTAFASGDYPEVFYVGQDAVDEYARAGVLAEPPEGAIADVEDIYPSLVDTFTYDGVLWCAAKDFSTLALEYNTDLFDQAGVDYPTADWTWDDLKNAATTITEETGTPGLTVSNDIMRWFAFYVEAGGTFYDDEGNFVFGQGDENMQAATDALQLYVDLRDAGALSTPAELGAGWAGEAFGQGGAAMTLEGNWVIQYLEDNFPDLNWGVSELPQGPAGKGTLVFSECYGVAADNDHPDESWALVDFLTGPEGAQRVAEGGFGVMPARASAGDLWLQTRGEEFQPFVTGAEYAVAPVFPPGYQEFTDALGNNIQQVLEGQMDVTEAIEGAVSVAQELSDE